MCTIPLAWSPNHEEQMKRAHRGDHALVKVYRSPARVGAAPEDQALTVEVPSMTPLP